MPRGASRAAPVAARLGPVRQHRQRRRAARQWRSPSTVGVEPPLPRDVGDRAVALRRPASAAGRRLSRGRLRREVGRPHGPAPLVLSVLEDKAEFDREIAVFERTRGPGWAAPRCCCCCRRPCCCAGAWRRCARWRARSARIEHGEQTTVEGRYPLEIAALTDNLNTLIEQERLRQTRYKEALSFLAHSLKTPLAVLRTALSEPAQLPAAVAAAGGAHGRHRAAPARPRRRERRRRASRRTWRWRRCCIASAIRSPRCTPTRAWFSRSTARRTLAWRIDEGDAFEMLGNLMDNAAKWATAAGRR